MSFKKITGFRMSCWRLAALAGSVWFTLACMQAVHAEPPVVMESEASLTLEQAIALSLAKNPALSAARREVEATEAQVLQGSLRPNPSLVYLTDDASRATNNSSAQIDIPIETAGKRLARVDAAERGKEVAVSDLTGRQLKIRASVMAAFFDVLAAQELTMLADGSAALAHRATEIAAKRVMAGKVSPVEETKARVAEAGARVALAQAESELRNARRRLSSLWGNTSPNFKHAIGELDALPEVPARELVERRLAISPLLDRAQREVIRRQSLVSVEQSKATPDLTFSVGMKRREDVQRDQVILGLSIPLPLFNRNQGNLLEALRREDKARDELQATQTALASEVLQALEQVRSRREEAELLRTDVLPGAKSAYEAATIGFENGKFSFLEVLDAQRTLFGAKSQYLNSLAAFHRAMTDLESMLGQNDMSLRP